jgi:hypothetical protein
MVEITSRKELEEWLKNKPADWAQVIAARAALRVFPYGFPGFSPNFWALNSALQIFRIYVMLWGAAEFNLHNMKPAVQAAIQARDAISYSGQEARACSSLIHSSISAAYVFDHVNTDYVMKAITALNNTNLTVDRGTVSQRVPRAANIIGDFWDGVYHDAAWLERSNISVVVNHNMSHIPFWQNAPPSGWQSQIERVAIALLALDPTYQVWIDWYNRRIEGHDAAFDIPGDTDRIHDKAILARLADASDEDFWGKGATYVNTTLQSWIDEARLTAELESVTRKLEFGAVTQFGSLQARETLAAFRAKLDYAVGNQPPAHAPIGHNQPPEGIDPAEAPILPPAIWEEAKAVLAMLDQPDRDSALETAKTLTRWSKIKSTYRHDKFSENSRV